MNILWLINIVLPEAGEALHIPSSVFGGWLTGALNGIRNEVDSITVLSQGPDNIDHVLECDSGNIHYVVFPDMKRDKLQDFFEEYLSGHHFDIIHIYGTEMAHSSIMMEVAPHEKTVINIQGLCSAIAQHYSEGIPNKYIEDTKIKSIYRRLTKKGELPVIYGYYCFHNKGISEVNILKKARYVIGRTNWDKACVLQINPESEYYHVNETLRDSFYTDRKWVPGECERHSIFLSQAGYPIKGLHYFLEALAIIKQYYPDVQVYIGGSCDIMRPDSQHSKKKKFILGGYWEYVNSLIADNGLYDCLHIMGLLSESQMVDRYLKSNVFVCPSTIENSPNSVGEAMMLGTPVVASYVGGVPDMLDNGKEGLLYPCSAPYMLADCVMRIFADDDLAMTMSRNAIVRAHLTHDKEMNTEELLGVYHFIMNNSNF